MEAGDEPDLSGWAARLRRKHFAGKEDEAALFRKAIYINSVSVILL